MKKEDVVGRRVWLEWPGNGGVVCAVSAVREPTKEEKSISPELILVVNNTHHVFTSTILKKI